MWKHYHFNEMVCGTGDSFTKRKKYRVPCPKKKRDSAIHSLCFSCIVFASRLHLQQPQCKADPKQICRQQRLDVVPPGNTKFLCEWRDRFVQWYNWNT